MRIELTLLFSLLIASTTLLGQSNSKLDSFYKSTTVDQIGTFFNTSIELEIPDSKGVYNKKQASVVINNFFKKHHPLKYNLIHEGGGNDQPFYEIGSLEAKNISFRTYFLFHLVKEKPEIIELRIEPSE